MITMVMMTDVDLEHNGKYQHAAGSRSKALPQKVFNGVCIVLFFASDEGKFCHICLCNKRTKFASLDSCFFAIRKFLRIH